MRISILIKGIVALMAVTMILVVMPIDSSARTPKGDLIVLFGSDLEGVDPYAKVGRFQETLLKNMYDYLYNRDGYNHTNPGLATDFEISDDCMSYSFTLRKGVKFHNGEPFTAEDVKFSIEYALDPKVAYSYAGAIQVKDVEIVDDYHIKFHLEKPNCIMLNNIAFRLPIMPKDYFEKVGPDGFTQKPVGTGRFKWVEWKRQEYWKLAANEDYWNKDEVPYVKTVTVKNVPEMSTRVAMMKAGEAHLMVDFPPYMLKEIKAADNLQVVSAPSGSVVRMWQPIAVAQAGTFPELNPMKDVRVRQALNYAIDRESIVKALWGGYAKLAPACVPLSIMPPASDLKPYPYDPEKAKKLLAEAGYPNGFTYHMLVTSGRYAMDRQSSEAIAAYFNQIGVKTKLEFVEGSEWLRRMKSRAKELVTGTYHPLTGTGGHPDFLFTFDLYDSGFWNMFSSAETDKLIEAARGLSDPKDFIPFYQNLDKKMYELAPRVFLWEPPYFHAVAKGVHYDPVIASMWTRFWDISID
ncbi:MAG: hypothetical protein CMM60_04840 [Rhodospirillaceae bacterium]|jgi:peptide/nickel transport system substrate-binding protein|nr:hypothetical protein [Rhodospirillaceae bacterium]|tara:strand:- start:674 stop:2239 length:1566 start_codon:yes stop_codon:yes gene_type:complete